MTPTGHDAKKIARYVLWLAKQEQKTLTPMQLLKLVYIAHGWMLGLYGRPLISDPVEAWPYGPVIPAVYNEYKSFRGNPITRCPDAEPDGIDAHESDLLRQVWKGYGGKTGVQLSSMTHQPGTPWDVTRRNAGRGAVISNDLIQEHYRLLKAQRG